MNEATQSGPALVTGGAGFLGSHVAERLVSMGVRVVVLDDLSTGFRRNPPAGAELCVGSVNDAMLVDALFRRHHFRWVFHLAAHAAEALSHFIRRHTYTVNLLGAITVINAAIAHRAECFVFTSSIAVHGEGCGTFDEDDDPVPGDPYGIAKLAVEHDLRAARALFGLRSVIFRPHNIYGERQNLADPYRNVLAIFMRQVLRGEPCSIFGDGRQTRAFTYVGDVASLIAESVLLPQAFDRTFNVGSDHACSVLELAERVQQALGRRTGVRHLPARPESKHLLGDHTQLRRVFGRQAETGLDEGIERTARWAETVRIGPQREFASLELTAGLPGAWPERLTADDPETSKGRDSGA